MQQSLLAVFLSIILATPVLGQTDSCFGPDAETALSHCEAELAAPDLLTRSEVAAFQRAQAGHLIALERFHEALEVLDQLAFYDGASEQHHYRRAKALHELGQAEPALAALQQALELNPQHLDSLLLRSALHLAANRLDAAAADAGLAATLAPESAAANTAMAAALAALGAKEAAARSREAAGQPPAAEVTGAGVATERSGTAGPATAQTNPPPGGSVRQPGGQTSSQVDLAFWNDVKDSDVPEEIELFLQTFPESVFAPLARLRLDRMRAAPVPAVQTAAQPVISPEPLPATTEIDIAAGSVGENFALASVELAGGQILTGGARSTTALGPPKGWVALYSNAGALIWDTTVRSEFETGLVTDVVAMRDGTLVAVDVQSDRWDAPHSAQLVAYDLSGDEIWRHGLGPVSREAGFVALAPLSDGGLLAVTGATAADKQQPDSLIVKLDARGQQLWRKVLRLAQEDSALGVTEGADGYLVVGTVLTKANGMGLPWVRKFTPEGTLVWARTLHSRAESHASDVVALEDGGAMVLGAHRQDGAFVNWLARLDDTGATLWEHSFAIGDESNVFRLAKLPDGEIAVAGAGRTEKYSEGSVAWVIYFDQMGREQARRVFGQHEEEGFFDASATHDGGVILSGGYQDDQAGNRVAWIKRLPPRQQVEAASFSAEASALLRRCVALAAHPDDSQSPYDTAGFLWDDFDAVQAQPICRLAYAIFPDNIHAAYHLGRVEHKQENWTRALELYGEAADRDHVRAMVGTAVIYNNGPEQLRDASRAADFLAAAVDQGADPIAAMLLARAYSDGRGVTRDESKALRHYRIAADAGRAEAQYQVGRHYDFGIGVVKNLATARTWYEKSSNNNHVRASYQLAYFYHWGLGGRQDRHRAFDLFRKAADAGDPDATLFIAEEFRWGGDVVRANHALARQWYQLAIERGAAEAYAKLGYYYQYGRGVPEDLPKALDYYRSGVKAGAGNSHYYLGRMYELGVQVDKDLDEAIRLYDIAVDKGDSSAMIALAYLHRDGVGTKKNEARAYKLFRQAADKYHLVGNREAGWLLFTGRGVPKDVKKAIAEIEKANDGTDELAAVYLGFIYETEAAVRNPELAAKYYFEGLEQGSSWPTTREIGDWNRATARALQRRLRDAGYYNGGIDGAMGRGSVAAMKRLCDC